MLFLWWEHSRSTLMANFKYTIQYCCLQSVALLCIRCPEFNPLIPGSMYTLTNISPFPPLQPLATTHLFSASMHLALLDSTYEWDHTVFVFLSLVYLAWHNVPKFHPCCHSGRISFFFYGWNIFNIVLIHSSVYHIILTDTPSSWPGRPDSNLEFLYTGVSHQNPAAWEGIAPSRIAACSTFSPHFQLLPAIMRRFMYIPIDILTTSPSSDNIQESTFLVVTLWSRADDTSSSIWGRSWYKSCK